MFILPYWGRAPLHIDILILKQQYQSIFSVFLSSRQLIYFCLTLDKYTAQPNGHLLARGQICMTETWLCVRLIRQLTTQDVAVKQRTSLSLPLVRVWGRRGWLFLHEYQAEECNARAAGLSHYKQLQVAETPSLSSSSSLPLVPSNTERSGTGLDSADIIMFAFASLWGSWVWCNWFSQWGAKLKIG